ncbi:hypothetical protein BpHYR1_041152 [Brachionus plicatilis]|uniref:Uncharacterized protein n=1 Tax=Brachionus plicatilis TaxID=10195 RepID=A0A3M7RSY5_BRAPC|nr:hypothetical protein BpHYR1_041152 [Brachionus plicatilis]
MKITENFKLYDIIGNIDFEGAIFLFAFLTIEFEKMLKKRSIFAFNGKKTNFKRDSEIDGDFRHKLPWFNLSNTHEFYVRGKQKNFASNI